MNEFAVSKGRCLWGLALVVVFPASMFPEAPKVYLVQRPGTSEKISYICQVILARKSHSRLRGWLTHPGDGYMSHPIRHLCCIKL